MCSTARPRFLSKATSGTPECLGCREIILAGTAAVGTDLPGRHAEIGDLPLEMGSTPVLCGSAGNGKVAPRAVAGTRVDLRKPKFDMRADPPLYRDLRE